MSMCMCISTSFALHMGATACSYAHKAHQDPLTSWLILAGFGGTTQNGKPQGGLWLWHTPIQPHPAKHSA